MIAILFSVNELYLIFTKMAIPKHDEIRIPALELLINSNTAMKLRDFEIPLARKFNLTEIELSQMYQSGNGPVFYDRISWALSYLNMAHLVEKPKRGAYLISEKGKELLKTPDKIDAYIKHTIDKEEQAKKEKNIVNEVSTDLTPQEKLYDSFEKIKKSRYNEIIETVLSKSPYEFEKLVVTLLQKMGYGGEIKNSGLVTQSTNDKGIDGIIKEDVLGLGRIYIQAKRYARENTIGRDEIQKFVGALAVAQSNKGVFITTSSYSKGGVEYASSLNGTTNLVLIDGKKLAEYIYEYNIGMQTEQTIKIKKLDSDFWDAMQDDVRR